MRGTERTRHVPIIFLTAGGAGARARLPGYEAGAVDFLFKPLDPQLLESKVRSSSSCSPAPAAVAQVEDTPAGAHGRAPHRRARPRSAHATRRHPHRGRGLRRAGDERAQKIASTIRTSSQRMTRLFEQLLDFGSARLGGLPVRPRPADLGRVCEEAMPRARARGVPSAASPGRPRRHLGSGSPPAGAVESGRQRREHGAHDTPVQVRLCGTDPAEVCGSR